MARKVTFTLDEQTIRRLRDAAERTKKPMSQVVREAVAGYHHRIGRLSEIERLRMLKAMEEIMARPTAGSQEDVDREIAEIRAARRQGGRRHRAE